MKRPAQIVAVKLEVQCPHCAEPLPNADGLDAWTKEQIIDAIKAAADRLSVICNSCEREFIVHMQSKAMIA